MIFIKTATRHIARSRTLLALRSRPTSRARSHGRTHYEARECVWYTRAGSRDMRERPCICFVYIRHGFEHGHTEHNLGESINDWRCKRRERARNGTRRTRSRRRKRGSEAGGRGGGETRGADPRHATFGFIVVYPVTVRFPCPFEILR